jgi:hypothetical protein
VFINSTKDSEIFEAIKIDEVSGDYLAEDPELSDSFVLEVNDSLGTTSYGGEGSFDYENFANEEVSKAEEVKERGLLERIREIEVQSRKELGGFRAVAEEVKGFIDPNLLNEMGECLKWDFDGIRENR